MRGFRDRLFPTAIPKHGCVLQAPANQERFSTCSARNGSRAYQACYKGGLRRWLPGEDGCNPEPESKGAHFAHSNPVATLGGGTGANQHQPKTGAVLRLRRCKTNGNALPFAPCGGAARAVTGAKFSAGCSCCNDPRRLTLVVTHPGRPTLWPATNCCNDPRRPTLVVTFWGPSERRRPLVATPLDG
jgi:hypothetical protein